MEYRDRCRTCLEKCNETRHIHSIIRINGQDTRLSDILFNFYSYQVPDELTSPEHICISCVHQLTLTHAFKNLIESSARTLSLSAASLESHSDVNDDCDYDSDFKPEIEYKPKVTSTLSYKTESRPKTRKIRSSMPLKRKQQIVLKGPPPKRKIYCVECKTLFHTSKSLLDHCSNNHPPKSQTGRDCEYCPEKFDDFKDLVIHRKLHLRPYLCLTCWAGFYEETEFNNHKCQPNQSRRSREQERVCQCDQCGKSYPPGYIKVHMMTHGNELKYSCKYCPKKFKVANGLNSHVLWNHKRTRDHKCEVCGATFISASARSTHIRKNHLKEKKYGCESCGKRFFSKSELQRHMLTHTGVKNFHCHLCENSYQTRYGLNVHLKSHAHMNVSVQSM